MKTTNANSADKEAHQIVQDHKAMFLSEEDRKVFVDALLNPTEPNKTLHEAAKEYEKALSTKIL